MAASDNVYTSMTADGAIWHLDACALHQLLANGHISAATVLDHYQARIENLNPQLNAFVCINDDAAKDAIESDKRRAVGEALSPIDGIPVAIKDNLMVKGMACSWGSKLFASEICDHDEIPIERLRSLGAIIVGKTNVPEFTLEGYTVNDLFGVTNNPWDLKSTPGGSSGGSVAAVAAGLVPVAFGTDGGGSIRRPAGFTGLVGLKPSIGRIPRGNGLPQLLLDFEVFCPVTRTVRDCKLIYSLMKGAHPSDHRSAVFSDTAKTTSRGLNIHYVDRIADGPLDPEIAERVDEAAQLLSALGHSVTRGPLPFDINAINEFWPKIGQFSLAKLLLDYPDMAKTVPEKYVEMAQEGRMLLATSVHRGLEAVWSLRDATNKAFQTIDIIMTPTSAAMPWLSAKSFPETIDGQQVGPRGHAIYTGWVNACGHPAIALPASPGNCGLPIGYQLVAGFGQEAMLLDVAADLENQNQWSSLWPDLGDTQ